MNSVRTAAAGLILAALAYFAVIISPAYWRNWQFQQSLNELMERVDTRPLPEDTILAQVRDRAARMGLRIPQDQIHVKRTAATLEISAFYVVRVDLPFYTVDLHFRPRVRKSE